MRTCALSMELLADCYELIATCVIGQCNNDYYRVICIIIIFWYLCKLHALAMEMTPTQCARPSECLITYAHARARRCAHL